jgi:Rap1a immunity proteins
MKRAYGTTRCAALMAVAVSCVALGGTPVRAGYFVDGNKLFDNCKEEGSPAGLYRDGYIVGITDAYAAVELGGFCLIGEHIRAEQVTDVVTLYLRDHPESRHLPAPALVIDALKEKFPCNAQ